MGPLLPLLWNIAVNNLITKLNNDQFYTIGYANNILITDKYTNTLWRDTSGATDGEMMVQSLQTIC